MPDRANGSHRPDTIAAVIERMDAIVDDCIRNESRMGYFAALYRNVTVKVRDGIAAGRFQDGPRMERLDVIFANRYLDAYEAFTVGRPPSKCWGVAFDAAGAGSHIILQHLLLGMNAHINLDLAIAAAQTSPGDDFAELKRDFEEITVLLGEMLDEVQNRLNSVSPWFGLLDIVGGNDDERLGAFGMRTARDLAWKAGGSLSYSPADLFDRQTALHDEVVTKLAQVIASPPGFIFRIGLALVRFRERKSVPEVIRALTIQ